MRFTAINLAEVTPPDILEELDVETIVTETRDDLVTRFPPVVGVIDLESEPARKLIESTSYRETLTRARVNDGVRAVLLASSWGSNLDHVAALFGVSRGLEEDEHGDLVTESDARLRGRVQLAPDAMSVAGPAGAYIYHGMTQASWARHASAVRMKPGKVRLTLLRSGDDPAPSSEELNAVRQFLLSEDVVPLTDDFEVASPKIARTDIEATITLYPGPDASLIKANALASLSAWIEANRLLGMNLRRSAIIAKLHVDGVHSVDLVSPASDIILDETEVYAVGSTDVAISKLRDE